jgi:hypothetical protein
MFSEFNFTVNLSHLMANLASMAPFSSVDAALVITEL